MSDRLSILAALPPEQEAIRATCFHPTGKFEEFRRNDVEQSVAGRSEGGQIFRSFGPVFTTRENQSPS